MNSPTPSPAVACAIPAAVTPATQRPRTTLIVGLIFLMTLVGTLVYYKWSGSFRTLEAVRAGGWTRSADALTAGGVLSGTLHYFGKVWIALLLGILIGAAVRALISPGWVGALLGKGGTVRRQLTGGLAGAPLMLCSCCVTPIFSGVYERGARLGSALSLMLASPALNLAALILTFMLFPLGMSLPRLAAALVAVFLLPVLIERLFGGKLKPVSAPKPDEDEGPRDIRDFAWRFAKSVVYLTLITVPLIAIGVLLSSLLLPIGLNSGGGAIVSIGVISAIGVMVALPTFFEIPLALVLMNLGAPGAAAAMLFVGPIVNLPSLFVLARETNAKVAAALAVGIWILGIAVGIVAIV